MIIRVSYPSQMLVSFLTNLISWSIFTTIHVRAWVRVCVCVFPQDMSKVMEKSEITHIFHSLVLHRIYKYDKRILLMKIFVWWQRRAWASLCEITTPLRKSDTIDHSQNKLLHNCQTFFPDNHFAANVSNVSWIFLSIYSHCHR